MPEEAIIEREKRLHGDDESLEKLDPALANNADLEAGNNYRPVQVLVACPFQMKRGGLLIALLPLTSLADLV